ncbi:MAG: 30S ribosomal protein S8 [Candidatus Promineifilaceae bacterium]
MPVSDPIADMLTRMRNAAMRQQETVSVPHSGVKEKVAAVLKDAGYLTDYEVLPETPQAVLRLSLKYVGDRRHRRPVITGIKRVSKPGRRVYVGRDEVPWVLSGMGIAILTTSRGIMTGQEARRQKLGGEVLCEIW